MVWSGLGNRKSKRSGLDPKIRVYQLPMVGGSAVFRFLDFSMKSRRGMIPLKKIFGSTNLWKRMIFEKEISMQISIFKKAKTLCIPYMSRYLKENISNIHLLFYS